MCLFLRQSNYYVRSLPSIVDQHVFYWRSQVKTDEGLTARMFRAQHHREGQLGHKLVLREIGEAVARELGRSEPLAPSVIARWLNGSQEPKGIAEWAALAKTFQVDPGWLAFGEDSAAPDPDAMEYDVRDPRKDQRISKRAVGRAIREQETDSQQRKSARSARPTSGRRPSESKE